MNVIDNYLTSFLLRAAWDMTVPHMFVDVIATDSGYLYGGNVTTTMFCRELYPNTFKRSYN